MKLLRIFNIYASRNKEKLGALNSPDKINLAIDKMLTIQREIDNNPKFLAILLDNLNYLIKTIDNLLISDNDINTEKMLLLIGQKKAYTYLYNILTMKADITQGKN